MTTETNNSGHRDGAITGGLTTGIIGTSLGALGLLGNGGLGNLLGGFGGCQRPMPPELVTKAEYESGLKLAAKDSEIAMLKAERDDEKKLVEVYAELERRLNIINDKVAANKEEAMERLDTRSALLNAKIDSNQEKSTERLACAIEKINSKIDFNKTAQDGVNALQLSYNAGNTATINCMQSQLAQLYSMTSLGIKNSSLCPGVPPVVISHPTTTTTTT